MLYRNVPVSANKYSKTDPDNFPITDFYYGHPRTNKIKYDNDFLSKQEEQDIRDMNLISELEQQQVISFTQRKPQIGISSNKFQPINGQSQQNQSSLQVQPQYKFQDPPPKQCIKPKIRVDFKDIRAEAFRKTQEKQNNTDNLVVKDVTLEQLDRVYNIFVNEQLHNQNKRLENKGHETNMKTQEKVFQRYNDADPDGEVLHVLLTQSIPYVLEHKRQQAIQQSKKAQQQFVGSLKQQNASNKMFLAAQNDDKYIKNLCQQIKFRQ